MDDNASRYEEFRIRDSEWDRGFRYKLRNAIDEALREYPDGTEAKIDEIWVIKRGDTSFHDYRVKVSTP